MLLSYLVPQLVNVSFLGLQLIAAVLDLPFVELDFRVNLNQSSLGYLVLCFRLQTHILDVSQVARVFLLDFVVLGVSVTCYLLQDFAVVASLVLYLGDKVRNLFIVFFDIERVLLSNFVHPRLMFHQLHLMCLAKLVHGHFLIRGQLLVPRSILQHPLVVLIPLILQLFMLLLLHLPQRSLVTLFQLLLLCFKLCYFVLPHAASVVQVIVEFVNFCFLLVGAHLVINALRTVVGGLVLLLCRVFGSFQILDFRLLD